jgi:hypothetical protein
MFVSARSAVLVTLSATALAFARNVDAQQLPNGRVLTNIVRFDGGEAGSRSAQRRRFVIRHLGRFRRCSEETAENLGLPYRSLHGVELRVVMPLAAHEETSPSATVTIASGPSVARDALRQCFERAVRAIPVPASARPTTVRFVMRLQFTTRRPFPHLPPEGTGGRGPGSDAS